MNGDASSAGDSVGRTRGAPRLRAVAAREVFGLPVVWVGALFVAPMLLSFAVYWPHLHDYFLSDDFLVLQQVHTHSTWNAIVRAFTFPTATVFDTPTPWWRPTTDLMFLLEHGVFGLDPTGYHATAFLFHAWTAGLGGLLVAKLVRSPAAGVITAALFVVSPAYSNAVPWISNLTELWPAFMSLVAILLFYAYLTLEAPSRARIALVGAVVALAIAMLGKESQALTGAVLFLLAVAIPGRRRPIREIAVAIALFTVVALPIGAYAYHHESRTSLSSDFFSTQLYVRVRDYLERMSLPFGSQDDASAVRAALAAAYLALGVGAVATQRRVPAFLFAWSLIVLVPFSANVLIFDPRYTYLSTLPFIAFWVTVVTEAARALSIQWRERLSLVLVVALPLMIIVLASETRRELDGIGIPGAQYKNAIRATREQCGDLPPLSHVYVGGALPNDRYQVNLVAAINVMYRQIYVSRDAPPAVAEPGRTCVVNIPPLPR